MDLIVCLLLPLAFLLVSLSLAYACYRLGFEEGERTADKRHLLNSIKEAED